MPLPQHPGEAPSWRARFIALWNEKLAPKDIYTRIGGHLYSFSINSSGQLMIAVTGGAIFIWLVYASSALTNHKIEAQTRIEQVLQLEQRYEASLAAMHKKHDALAARLASAQSRFAQITADMEARHNHLISVLGKSSQLGQVLEERRDAYKERLPEEINRRSNRNRLNTDDGQSNILFPLNQGNYDGLDFGILTARPPDLTSGAFRLERNGADKIGFSTAEAGLHLRGVLAGTGDAAVDGIIARLEWMDEEQQMVSHHLSRILQSRLHYYETAINIMGVFDTARLIERIERRYAAGPNNNPGAQGGAYVPIENEDQPGLFGEGSETLGRTDHILLHLEQVDRLISHLPILMPMHQPYYITSGFGARIDPFTQKWAFHGGIDLASSDRKNRSVVSSLPGKVVHAGNSINFGNMIQIDHGFGISTLYGHLKEIYVTRGADVKQNQKIATLGNSGRSTGEHLHYEILIDGKQYDPWKFVEAGKYVFNIKNE